MLNVLCEVSIKPYKHRTFTIQWQAVKHLPIFRSQKVPGTYILTSRGPKKRGLFGTYKLFLLIMNGECRNFYTVIGNMSKCYVKWVLSPINIEHSVASCKQFPIFRSQKVPDTPIFSPRGPKKWGLFGTYKLFFFLILNGECRNFYTVIGRKK